MVEIQLVKGPISKHHIEQIVRLYGLVDAKYASVEYCNYLFNNNPFGFSIHAFAVVDRQIVGHISLIPMYIDTPDGIRISLKAEAFYLDPEYRDNWVDYQEDSLPLGLALPKVLYDFALRDDFKVIHLLADDEVGKIHCFAGCKKLIFSVKESFLILSDKEYINREKKLQRKVMIKALCVLQRCISTVFCFIFALLRKNSCNIVSLDSNTFPLNSIIKNPWQWSIDLNEEYRKWLADSPYIKVCFYDDAKDDFIIFKMSEYKNRVTEIIGCYSRFNNSKRLAKTINCVVRHAIAHQASSVNFKLFPNQNYSKSMITALKISGFFNKTTNLNCFVKSSEADYLKRENLAYCPFYYIQF